MTVVCSVRTAAEIAHALAARCEEVAIALLGGPSSSTRRELRWGRRGSLTLRRMGAKRGDWYDFEGGAGERLTVPHDGGPR